MSVMPHSWRVPIRRPDHDGAGAAHWAVGVARGAIDRGRAGYMQDLTPVFVVFPIILRYRRKASAGLPSLPQRGRKLTSARAGLV